MVVACKHVKMHQVSRHAEVSTRKVRYKKMDVEKRLLNPVRAHANVASDGNERG